MKKFVSNRIKDIVLLACHNKDIPFKKGMHRRAKKYYLGLSFKAKIKAIA